MNKSRNLYRACAAGLYDKDGNMLCSWEDSGIDIEKDYTSSSYKTDVTSCYYIITNKYPTTVKVVIPNGVTGIGNNAFSDCSSLVNIMIPDSVTNIGNRAFYYCTALTDITIPDGVTSIKENTFEYCDSLTSITIPDSVTSIGRRAFYFCRSLADIIIPDSVTSIGYEAFDSCHMLQNIYVADGNTVFCDIDGVLFKKLSDGTDGLTLFAFPRGRGAISTSYAIPDGTVELIDGAFKNCWFLTDIIMPDSIKTIGSFAFYDCSGLENVNIPDGVTTIGTYAFGNVPHITYHGSVAGSPWGATAMN